MLLLICKLSINSKQTLDTNSKQLGIFMQLKIVKISCKGYQWNKKESKNSGCTFYKTNLSKIGKLVWNIASRDKDEDK